jgi:hypothetical protein
VVEQRQRSAPLYTPQVNEAFSRSLKALVLIHPSYADLVNHPPRTFWNISTVDADESQFMIGTETASDVFTVHGEGVMPRHAWVWISEAGLQVEDLGGGTRVNGYQISEWVQVEHPASVQVGDVTLVVEVKAAQPVVVPPTPSSLDITISQRAVTKSKASLEVTILQRTPTRGNVQKTPSTGTPSSHFSAPRDDTARASCGNGAKANSCYEVGQA